jgi:hypothetical protein
MTDILDYIYSIYFLFGLTAISCFVALAFLWLCRTGKKCLRAREEETP